MLHKKRRRCTPTQVADFCNLPTLTMTAGSSPTFCILAAEWPTGQKIAGRNFNRLMYKIVNFTFFSWNVTNFENHWQMHPWARPCVEYVISYSIDLHRLVGGLCFTYYNINRAHIQESVGFLLDCWSVSLFFWSSSVGAFLCFNAWANM